MDTLVISWHDISLALVVVAITFGAQWLLLRRLAKRNSQSLSSLGYNDSSMLQPVHLELAELRKQLEKQQKEIDQLLKSIQPSSSLTPYSQAIQMAQRGLDAAAIASSCGISRGEAELVVALYRSQSSQTR